jgi:hypothetical protein
MQQRPFRNVTKAQIHGNFEEWQNATDHFGSRMFYPKQAYEKFNQ